VNTGNKELIAVLITMGIILVFALVVVGVFFSVLRREKRNKD
jgi:cbb3-type cytochrome oxidase subunit 3